jgi:hypothetical protein
MNAVFEQRRIWTERMAAVLDMYYGDRLSWHHPSADGGLIQVVVAACPHSMNARLPDGWVRYTAQEWAEGWKRHVASVRQQLLMESWSRGRTDLATERFDIDTDHR